MGIPLTPATIAVAQDVVPYDFPTLPFRGALIDLINGALSCVGYSDATGWANTWLAKERNSYCGRTFQWRGKGFFVKEKLFHNVA
jgi:hypothetical protein